MNVLIESDPLPKVATVLAAIGASAADFMWYVASIEANGWPQDINNCWLLGSELDAYIENHGTEFVWGVLDAFRPGPRFEVLDVPYADGNAALWTNASSDPQLRGASFEIVYWDSSAMMLIGFQEKHVQLLLAAFPKARRI